MARKIYKCRLCGSVVEVLSRGGGGLSCCGAAVIAWGREGSPAFSEPAQLIDLEEITEQGQSCWRFPHRKKPQKAADEQIAPD